VRRLRSDVDQVHLTVGRKLAARRAGASRSVSPGPAAALPRLAFLVSFDAASVRRVLRPDDRGLANLLRALQLLLKLLALLIGLAAVHRLNALGGGGLLDRVLHVYRPDGHTTTSAWPRPVPGIRP